MARIEAKLAELELILPAAFVYPNPNRTGAVRVGELLFVSGHPPVGVEGVKSAGKVGAELSEEEGYLAARACALNILSTARQVLSDLDRVRRVVKVLGFVNTAPGFNRQFAVIDGASDLFLALYGPDGVHARSAVGVYELPRGFPVEVEAVLQITP